ncbi:hypothetical protein IFM89_023618 [Coptis chinensis]|uniref:Uncharacterized protein n=1 Tax=Coptis chinensis TaxID=261450 RepID=A0A835LN84_9MAGN|nr:hypothetical protein IFM89_023618 [Coptis chinensis]
MANVCTAECKVFTQIYAIMTRSKAREKHQVPPIQESPRNHEQDIDISTTMDTDSVAAENEVVQDDDFAPDSETDLADNTPEIPEDQFSDIEFMKLIIPDWQTNVDILAREKAMVEELRDEAKPYRIS